MKLGRWIHGMVAILGSVMMLAATADAEAARARSHAPSVSKQPGKSQTAKKAKAGRTSVARVPSYRSARQARLARGGRSMASRRARMAVMPVLVRPSQGVLSGLHRADDPLALRSSVAMVIDQDSDEVLLAKNAQAVLPIASLTKLMTALVVVEAHQPMDELLVIEDADVDTEKGSHSRLGVGTQLTRAGMLHLALMSSENRAANALGRHWPGGLAAFVEAMNRKADELGMVATHYVEPTGLSSANQSSARDLAHLVKHAYRHTLIRELSTTADSLVAIGERTLHFRNTNSLVRSPEWEIGLQKTGYIAEAGRCLVMQARMAGRRLIMVFLDSSGRYSRQADAERVRRWLTQRDTEVQASALPKLTS